MERIGTLSLTHSSRRTNLERATVQFLTHRFGDPGRLRALPPFETLKPPASLFSGAVSFFAVLADANGGVRLRQLGRFRRREKIQQVAFHSDRELLVGFECFVERWRLRTSIDRAESIGERDVLSRTRVEHPHLAGLHTLEPTPDRKSILLSCASPDAVLVLDTKTNALDRELRMPAELYDRGYELTADMDLRRHYIGDHHQITHLNAASADSLGRWVVVSTLIQGALGVFDLETGRYQELARGFVGCHGARFNHLDHVYFADSVTGTLVFLNGDGGVERRFAVPSRWLHDVQQISGSSYAFALADSNELRVYDIDNDELLYRRRFLTWPTDHFFSIARRWPGWMGNSTQALAFRPAGAS